MKLLLICLIPLLICGCEQKESTKQNPKIIFKEEDIEVYSDIYLEDIIKKTNVDIVDYKLKTDVIGKKEIEFYYKIDNKKILSSHTINIVDKESPKIFGGSNKTLVKNTQMDLCNLVMYADNYDNEPLCIVEGNYDLDKVGTYNIRIVVTDASGNSNNHNITLNVIEKSSSSNNSYSTYNYPFTDAYQKYKADNTLLGIDVSEWQGKVDYEKVKDSKASFVIMRIGYSTGTEYKMDGQFLNNIKSAKEAGLKVGVYFYSKALSKESAKKEAEWVVKTLNNEALDLPVFFDWEIWSNWNLYHLSFHSLNEIAKSFITTIEDNNYTASLYGSMFYLANFWDNTYNDVWLAHYTSQTNYQGKYFIWQFSNQGRIDGIHGDVDMNVMYEN